MQGIACRFVRIVTFLIDTVWVSVLNKPMDARFARLYDLSVPDWPGEIRFYDELIESITKSQKKILELGCGTGRVAIQLAAKGRMITGLDISESMLELARRKSKDMVGLDWIQADMKTFDLGNLFEVVIIPGHSFQFMLTCEDQLECLARIKRHLDPDGCAVIHIDHQDIVWLGNLRSGRGGVFEPSGVVIDPVTHNQIKSYKAWQYDSATQTASCLTRREEIDKHGIVLDRWETGPVHLHCIFRFEMEHLLVRAGFMIEALYGDFFKQDLTDKSTEMVWVVRPDQNL